MEAILKLLTEEGSIKKNKFFRILEAFFIMVISAWLFQIIFWEYDIVNLSEPNEIFLFIINGNFFGGIICTSFVWLSFKLVRFILSFLYLFIFVRNAKNRLFKRTSKTWEEIEQSGISFYSIFPPFFIKILIELDAIDKEDEELIFEDQFAEDTRKYLNDPMIIVRNSNKIFEFYLEFICAYCVTNQFFIFPNWMNVLASIFTLLFFSFFILVMRDFSRLHVIVPILRKNEIITRSELKVESKRKDELT